MSELLRALLGLPPAASTVAGDVDGLHFLVITATMLVATYVLVSAAWFAFRHARRHEGQLTERLVATRKHEALTIGVVLGAFLLFWVIGYRQYLRMTQPPADADVVFVEAKQWMWKFSYADGRDANDVLTVPAGRPIRLVMSSRDVIHSFYVPAFRIKADVLPGRETTAWFEAKEPGTYPIWCAEYCGTSHSRMRGEVVVLSPEDYARWRGTRGTGDLASLGREVAMRRGCAACHTLDGQRHIGPTWSGLYGSERVLADGRRIVADDAYLTRSMMDPLADVVAGYPQVMPTYRGQLSAAEAGALVELIKSLRAGPTASAGILPPLDVAPASDAGRAP
jgi:cytochrome c oxidase subunit 2